MIPAAVDVLADYVACAVWAEADTDREDCPGGAETVDDLANYGENLELVEGFLAENGEDVDAALSVRDYSPDMIGHDLWLTRNRHGAGFWDRGLGAIGERLTEAAHGLGESYAYIGDNGRLYLEP